MRRPAVGHLSAKASSLTPMRSMKADNIHHTRPIVLPQGHDARAIQRKTDNVALLVSLFLQGGGIVIAFAQHMCLAHWMRNVDAYGEYTTLFIVATLGGTAAALGLPSATVRFMASHRAHGDAIGSRAVVLTARRIVLRWGTRLGAILAIGAVIAGLGLLPKARDLVPVACSVPLFALGYLYAEAYRAEERMFLSLVFERALRPILVTAAVFVLWRYYAPPTCTTVIWVLFAILAITTSAQLWLFHARQPTVLRFGPAAASPPRRPEEADLLRVAIPLLVSSGIGLLMSQGSVVLVAMLAGDRAAALFGVASRMSIIASVSTQVVNNIAAPRIAALHARSDGAGLRRAVARFTHLTFWPALTCVVLVAIFSSHLLALFGPAYSEARWCLVIMLVGQLINAGTGLCGPVLAMTGYQNYLPRVLGSSLLAVLALDLALVPQLGIVGAAIGDACAVAFWNIWCVALGRRHLGVDSSILGALSFSTR